MVNGSHAGDSANAQRWSVGECFADDFGVRDAMDRVIGISKIARDVTERVEVEAKLRDQAKQRDMFLAMLSHELRNPLSAVLTATRLLSDPRAAESLHSRAMKRFNARPQ